MTDPQVLVTFFKGLGFPVTRIGLEAGPLSQWLYAGLTQAGFDTGRRGHLWFRLGCPDVRLGGAELGRRPEFQHRDLVGIHVLFEPVCNLLHGGHQRFRRGMTEFSTIATESLYQYVGDSTPRIR